MISATKSPYTDDQMATWLRGLLTIAWADGHFDSEERDLITQIMHEDLSLSTDIGDYEQISPDELAATLGKDNTTAENFMRTAVMVAVADGVYSSAESELLSSFCGALGLQVDALKSLEHTLYEPETGTARAAAIHPPSSDSPYPHSHVLDPVKEWMDGMEVHDPRLARFICRLVPSQCPFERDVTLFGRKIVHIPPLCKINPLYEQLVGLRFRALSYLADEYGEDVTPYL